MRTRNFLLLVMFGSLCLSAISSWGEVSSTTTNASLKKGDEVYILAEVPERATAGESIVIKLILKNDSGEDVLCAHGSPERDFSIAIKDSSGVAVPMTRFGRQVMQGNPRDSYKYNVKLLSSGKSVQVSLNIARLFDLTIADKYTISVARTINEDLSGKERQVSMKTTFVVQEPR